MTQTTTLIDGDYDGCSFQKDTMTPKGGSCGNEHGCRQSDSDGACDAGYGDLKPEKNRIGSTVIILLQCDDGGG